MLPCLPPHGGGLAVEGVSLKRQRGRAPVEVLYHSKRHHGSSPASSSSSQFPVERVQLSSATGPGGITFNLTLRQLQPDDSGLYSCQLLLRGRPESSTSLGRQVFFVSVKGGSQQDLMARLLKRTCIFFRLLTISFFNCCSPMCFLHLICAAVYQ